MWLILLIIIALGLSFGSFANCLVWRLYRQEKISGRSYCPRCLRQLWWHDNIPLFSYLRLGGRCRFCRQPISWQYPAVEAAVAILFVFFWFKHLGFIWPDAESLGLFFNLNFWLALVRDYLAVFVLTVVFVFDLRFYLVSNAVVMPAAIVFAGLNLLLGASWYVLLLGIAGALAFFGLQFILTRGRGLGEGDIWLGLLLATLFPNWSLLILAILSAYLLGTAVGLALIIAGRKEWGSKLPLGVFLALGALITLAWGPALVAAYWSFQL
ncbi:MAG: prepilin peptidase [Patescibacteria group bacterium]|nr:prepilin peptidase [Patescibacteria group bacterium]